MILAVLAFSLQAVASETAPPPRTDAQVVGALIDDGDCNAAIRYALRSGDLQLARSARDYCDTDERPWRNDPPVYSDDPTATASTLEGAAADAADAAAALERQQPQPPVVREKPNR